VVRALDRLLGSRAGLKGSGRIENHVHDRTFEEFCRGKQSPWVGNFGRRAVVADRVTTIAKVLQELNILKDLDLRYVLELRSVNLGKDHRPVSLQQLPCPLENKEFGSFGIDLDKGHMSLWSRLED